MIKVIGHRGAPALLPENTIASVVKALELGVDGVEVDVRATKDRVLVLFHDEGLERLAGVRALLSERTYSYISTIRVRGERIPRFEEFLEVVERYPNKIFFVEVKEPELVGTVADAAVERGLGDRVVVISFFHRALLAARRRGLRVGVIFVCRPVELRRLVEGVDPSFVFPRYDMVDEELVDEAHRIGAEVCPWVVNDAAALHKMVELGVDWVATDHPERVLKLLQQKRLI